MPRLSPQEKTRRRAIYRHLYSIERRYGLKVYLYKYEQGSTNVETGKITGTTREKVKIPRFISWESRVGEKFEYDISFIKANSNFAYGGLFEVGDRMAVVSRRQLPDDLEIDLSYYIVIRGERWNIHRFTELDSRAGFLLHIRKVNDQLPHQSLDLLKQHSIILEQDITATL